MTGDTGDNTGSTGDIRPETQKREDQRSRRDKTGDTGDTTGHTGEIRPETQ